jgi:hypothetical protein
MREISVAAISDGRHESAMVAGKWRFRLVPSAALVCWLQESGTRPVLCARAAKLGWAMADELELQLERIEHSVAEIVGAVQKLRDDRAAAREAASGEINQRLRRFLERKKQA